MVRVLVVDASPLVRQLLARALARDPGIDVVATAGDAFEARDHIVRLRPDVMTLDIDMPRMDGIEFLRRLMPQYPMPVVVVSSVTRYGARTAVESLEAGAVDFVQKPSHLTGGGFEGMVEQLRRKVKNARARFDTRSPELRRNPRARQPPASGGLPTHGHLIAIGASTGGVEALRTVLQAFPARVPGIVIVQHMPLDFTGSFARRLDELCAISAKEAQHGDPIQPGMCLLAPGDQQLRVVHDGRSTRVVLSNGPRVDGHRPSATVMMQSVATAMGPRASGAILTGMGRDGAEGLLAMRQAGAHTVVQDEATSVVYGMPKAAWECGAARFQLPLEHIANSLLRPFRKLQT